MLYKGSYLYNHFQITFVKLFFCVIVVLMNVNI